MGKLTAPDNLSEAIAASYFETLPITVKHGMKAGSLPEIHKDPFDRMLIAQAQIENLVIVTYDRKFANYDVNLL